MKKQAKKVDKLIEKRWFNATGVQRDND